MLYLARYTSVRELVLLNHVFVEYCRLYFESIYI